MRSRPGSVNVPDCCLVGPEKHLLNLRIRDHFTLSGGLFRSASQSVSDVGSIQRVWSNEAQSIGCDPENKHADISYDPYPRDRPPHAGQSAAVLDVRWPCTGAVHLAISQAFHLQSQVEN
jgi:hypothetical protein